MKTYEIVIEETCAETFKFELPDDADIYEYVRENYYKCNIVLEPGECQFRQMQIHYLDDGSYCNRKPLTTALIYRQNNQLKRAFADLRL